MCVRERECVCVCVCVCVIISKQCKASYSGVHVHGKYCCVVDLFLGWIQVQCVHGRWCFIRDIDSERVAMLLIHFPDNCRCSVCGSYADDGHSQVMHHASHRQSPSLWGCRTQVRCQELTEFSHWALGPASCSYSPTSFQSDCHMAQSWLVDCRRIWVWLPYGTVMTGGLYEDLSLTAIWHCHDWWIVWGFESDCHMAQSWLVDCMRIWVWLPYGTVMTGGLHKEFSLNPSFIWL